MQRTNFRRGRVYAGSLNGCRYSVSTYGGRAQFTVRTHEFVIVEGTRPDAADAFAEVLALATGGVA